jgi:eukaryotic-like serine/threonine-protein kinase
MLGGTPRTRTTGDFDTYVVFCPIVPLTSFTPLGPPDTTMVRLNNPGNEPEAEDETFPGEPVMTRGSAAPGPVNPSVGPLDGSVDRYELHRPLGRGSMGEVHLCRDGWIGRDVAMKVLLPAHRPDPQLRARFLREACVQGQLEHPSIVPVYDLGVDETGAMYFTMKRLRGMTLGEIVRGLREKSPEVTRQFPLRRLLAAFASVCLTMDFAHSRGVLHRDLKPANVMLGDFGEVYVLDWGLAKLMELSDQDTSLAVRDPSSDEIHTAAGRILGTFGYMAPEQALGKIAELDARSDVYALGALLFEILTLTALHPKTSWNAMLHSTLKGASARPSLRAPELDVPPELEAICVKATRTEPKERYQTARKLHDAVEQFLNGDRDVELRRHLAAQHAEAATEAAAKVASDSGPSESFRREALNEVARSLALDPTNEPAMRALAHVITAPPREVPREVTLDLEAAATGRIRHLLRDGALFDFAGLALLTPIAVWMGVRNWPLLGAWAALTVTSSAAKLVASRRKARTSSAVHLGAYAAYVLSILAYGCLSRCFGPLIFTPGILAVATFAYCMSHDARYRFTVLLTGCAGLLAPLLLELSGVLPASYAFDAAGMRVLSGATRFPEVPTLFALTIAGLFMILGAGFLMGRIQRGLHEAELRSHLHAWHLRQLLPEEARAPVVRASSA